MSETSVKAWLPSPHPGSFFKANWALFRLGRVKSHPGGRGAYPESVTGKSHLSWAGSHWNPFLPSSVVCWKWAMWMVCSNNLLLCWPLLEGDVEAPTQHGTFPAVCPNRLPGNLGLALQQTVFLPSTRPSRCLTGCRVPVVGLQNAHPICRWPREWLKSLGCPGCSMSPVRSPNLLRRSPWLLSGARPPSDCWPTRLLQVLRAKHQL